MIAHRLKTVEHADQILVVDHGKIVQWESVCAEPSSGCHQETIRGLSIATAPCLKAALFNDSQPNQGFIDAFIVVRSGDICKSILQFFRRIPHKEWMRDRLKHF